MIFKLFPALLCIGCATASITDKVRSTIDPLSTAMASIHTKADGLKTDIATQAQDIGKLSGSVAGVDRKASELVAVVDSLKKEIEQAKNQVPQVIKERVVEKVERIESKVNVIGGLSLEKQKQLFSRINEQREALNQQMKAIGSRLDSLKSVANPSTIMDKVATAGLFGWVALLGAILTKMLRKPSTGRE